MEQCPHSWNALPESYLTKQNESVLTSMSYQDKHILIHLLGQR